MHLGVLSNPDSWYLRDLQRAAANRVRISTFAFTQLASTVRQPVCRIQAGEGDLNHCDAILVRTMPPGSLEQVVFRMDTLNRLQAYGTLVVNPPRALEIAVDKYLATAKLQQAGLTIPETIVCQTVESALQAFSSLDNDVVLKPLFGSEGRGITRITDEAVALRAFKLLVSLGAVLYLQRFVPHEGFDIRLLVIGDTVLGMRRWNPHDWRTNVSRGATAERLNVDERYRELAMCAARAVGAPLAGVDLLPGRDGTLYAIEVNAVPGWRAMARVSEVDVADRILRFVEQERATMGNKASDC